MEQAWSEHHHETSACHLVLYVDGSGLLAADSTVSVPMGRLAFRWVALFMRRRFLPQIGDRLVYFWRPVCGVGIEAHYALENRLFVLLPARASSATWNL